MNNASGVALASNVSWNNTGQVTTITAGDLNMAGFSLTLKSLTLAVGTTVTKTAGTLTVNGANIGAGAYSSGTINP